MASTGLITINGKRIIEVDASPASSGVAAAIGSLALFDDSGTGRLFIKTGSGNTAWTEAGAGSLANVVEDTTPQLGGNLDTNGFNVISAADATADANPTDSIIILSGNKTAGTGNSGSITIQTGTSAGGVRGSFIVNATDLNMSSTKIVSLADPTAAQDAATKNYADTTFLALAGGTMSGAIAMGTNQITGLGDPSLAQDAATKNYADTTFLALAGGTMSGAIAMGTSKITGLGDPTVAQDAATKNYTDITFLALSGGTLSGSIAMGSNSITGLADPTNPQDAATKAYVDSVSAGLDPKASVRVATTAVLSGTMTADDVAPTTGNRSYNVAAKTITWFAAQGPTAIDGITLSNGDRILVKDESATSGPSAGEGRIYNGIYVRTSADVWTRAEDHDGTPAGEVSSGNFAFVEQGTANASKGYVLQGNGVLTLQTDNIVFVQFSDANVDTNAFATSALDNLASVAINTSLISDTALTDDLGSAAIPWLATRSGSLVLYSAASTEEGSIIVGASSMTMATPDVAGATNGVVVTSGDSSGAASGSVTIQSGDASTERGDVIVSSKDFARYYRGTVAAPSAIAVETGSSANVAGAGSGVVVDNSVSLDEDQFMLIEYTIVAYDTVSGDSNVYKRTVHAKRLTGGNATVILVSSDFTSEEDASWDVSIAANTGTQVIEVQADGDAANTTTWSVIANVTLNA